ncbi:MAG: hypothetical protein ACKN97_08655 [Acidobacteriota bacterium]
MDIAGIEFALEQTHRTKERQFPGCGRGYRPMSAQHKIKLIKKGAMRQAALISKVNIFEVKPRNTEATVAGWVREFQTRKRSAPKTDGGFHQESLGDSNSRDTSD